MNRHLSAILVRAFVTLALLNVSKGIRSRYGVHWLIVPEAALLLALLATIIAEALVWRSETGGNP